jgi:recombination protein U
MSNQLEKRLNRVNGKYNKKKKTVIYKVPTPIIPTKKGLIAQSSTVDYVGIIEGGKFLAFDAKETSIKTRFPIKNVKRHQVEYLDRVEQLGGIAFFYVHFKKVHKDQAFLTPV